MTSEGAVTIIFATVVVSCGLIWPFYLCHYGTHATDHIRSIDLSIYNAKWLHYPPELRKHVILIIAQSRSKIKFNGFNLIGCTLEAFANVRYLFCYLLFSNGFTDSIFFSSHRFVDHLARTMSSLDALHNAKFQNDGQSTISAKVNHENGICVKARLQYVDIKLSKLVDHMRTVTPSTQIRDFFTIFKKDFYNFSFPTDKKKTK